MAFMRPGNIGQISIGNTGGGMRRRPIRGLSTVT